MNRLDFIKRLVVATAAVAAIPVLSKCIAGSAQPIRRV